MAPAGISKSLHPCDLFIYFFKENKNAQVFLSLHMSMLRTLPKKHQKMKKGRLCNINAHFHIILTAETLVSIIISVTFSAIRIVDQVSGVRVNLLFLVYHRS